jgi:hypothetical protein
LSACALRRTSSPACSGRTEKIELHHEDADGEQPEDEEHDLLRVTLDNADSLELHRLTSRRPRAPS